MNEFIGHLKTLEDINQEILDIHNQEVSGVLTVYSRPSIAQCWLVPRISDFTERYPSIELNLFTGNDDINFRGYGIDLAIYFDDKQLQNLYCEDLISESIIPVCSPKYAKNMSLLAIFIIFLIVLCYMIGKLGAITLISMNGELGVNIWGFHFS